MLPSTVLNERKNPPVTKKKEKLDLNLWGDWDFEQCNAGGWLPARAPQKEEAVGARHRSWLWDLHLPGGSGVLSAPVRGAAVSPLLALLHYS